ncbi:basic salivary proline-rich protein 2-like [Meles meles]|uniref:basic salivary proline-rich protein 2-like n=1 Tax=Meles meles TaxID=9662 RepID=UPI001E69CA8A|nr:basic salivary proline-rich protein 2-like [Meles meles]
MEEALGPDNTHTVKALPPTSWHLTNVFGAGPPPPPLRRDPRAPPPAAERCPVPPHRGLLGARGVPDPGAAQGAPATAPALAGQPGTGGRCPRGRSYNFAARLGVGGVRSAGPPGAHAAPGPGLPAAPRLRPGRVRRQRPFPCGPVPGGAARGPCPSPGEALAHRPGASQPRGLRRPLGAGPAGPQAQGVRDTAAFPGQPQGPSPRRPAPVQGSRAPGRVRRSSVHPVHRPPHPPHIRVRSRTGRAAAPSSRLRGPGVAAVRSPDLGAAGHGCLRPRAWGRSQRGRPRVLELIQARRADPSHLGRRNRRKLGPARLLLECSPPPRDSGYWNGSRKPAEGSPQTPI